VAGIHEAFVALMQGRGQVEPDEDVLGDGIAFAGVAKFPARVKCALLPWMAFKDAAVRAGVEAIDAELAGMISPTELDGLRAGLTALAAIKERMGETAGAPRRGPES